MSCYLVTGASGFLGKHVVATLKQQGHEVVALVRTRDAQLEALGATVHQGDVLAISSIQAALKGCEGVFHCAGKVSRKPEDAEALYRVHVQGTRFVLQAAQKAGVRRVVIASTSGTVAISEKPNIVATEEHNAPLALLYRWPYYRTKLFAEQIALSMNRPGFDVISVNPSLLLGPGDLRGSGTGDVRLFLKGHVPLVPAGGLSFVDVRDAAYGTVLAMKRGESGHRYLLGSCNLTLMDFFARLGRFADRSSPRFRVPPLPFWLRTSMQHLLETAVPKKLPFDPVSWDMGQYFWYVNATRAQKELGWKPRSPDITLEETVQDLLARRSNAP